jgi:TolA-binding protein
MFRPRAVVGVFALAFLIVGLTHGQGTTDKKVKGTLPPNWAKLGLTDKQKQEVYKIQSDYADKIADLETKIKDLKDKSKTDMEKVLTKEQKERLKEILTGKVPSEKD